MVYQDRLDGDEEGGVESGEREGGRYEVVLTGEK